MVVSTRVAPAAIVVGAKGDRQNAMKPCFETSSRQTSLRKSVVVSGRGVHGDAPARLTLSPAEAGTGIVFATRDGDNPIAAHWTNVRSTRLRTEIAAGAARVSTIEHLMAAFAGLGVDNALVEIDESEVPALDGSALPFVAAIRQAGIARLGASRRVIKIVETVRLSDGAGWAEFAPTNRGCLDLDVEIAFPGAIGRQRIALPLTSPIFGREIASARSFGFLRDAEQLWRQGLALGASLENCVIFDGDRVLNPQGLRFPNEMARHKMLDVIGDLALAGAPIHGAFRSYRGGHGLNLALIERLMTTPSAYVMSKDAEGSTPRVRRRETEATGLGLGLSP
jgi:UDP-3-O-[3-hydroxymyristoyl] N-acetylglucosamine deacetylase